MRISIVSPDLSSNAMARTCPIAETLSQNHEIEILGFDGGTGFFEPYENVFEYEVFRGGRTPIGLFRNLNRMERRITGDLVYAFRPQVGSLGVGLLHKRRTGTPVVLDVEDFVRFEEYGIPRKLYNSLVFSGSPTGGIYASLLDRYIDEVDTVTVTSSRLQQRYGGTILPYGPDATTFDPDLVDPSPDLSSEYDDTPIIMFIGSIRPHKGLDVLADSISMADHDVRLVIAGYDPHGQLQELQRRSDYRIDFRGPIPHEAVPAYLASADIIAIPQHSTRYTEAQIPNKVFEAMAMAKPILASNVSDLPEILDGCGRLVGSGNPRELAAAIDDLLEDPNSAKELGLRARERYIDHYGREILCSRLESVLSSATTPDY